MKVFVVLRPGQEPSRALADDLFLFTRANLTPYKASKILEFVAELPRAIRGKIRRVDLRAKQAEARAATGRRPEGCPFTNLREA